MANPRKMPTAYTRLLYCVDALADAHQGGTLTASVLQMYGEAIKGHARELAQSHGQACAAAHRLVETLEGRARG